MHSELEKGFVSKGVMCPKDEQFVTNTKCRDCKYMKHEGLYNIFCKYKYSNSGKIKNDRK